MISECLYGIFCKYCFLFAEVGGIHGQVQLLKLVTLPLKSYSKLLGKDGDLQIHDCNAYHKIAMLAASDFIRTYECPLTDNIALRGHRDDGQIFEINQNSSLINDGNLRELLCFRVSARDNILKNHLNNCNSKATYISKSIQNEIIELCAQQIQGLIKTRIFKGKFHSVIFDETTNNSHSSQMTIVLRYIDVYTCEIREDFIGFVNCHTENYSNFTYEPVITGELLANTVANTLTKFGFNLKYCIGIGTDGCSLMLGKNNGAVTKLQKIQPSAIKSPCYNHALNLSVSKCSSVRAVRNKIGTMKKVKSFFKGSPKRSNVLKYINKGMLTSLCETRWIERHDSVLSFKSCLTTNVLNTTVSLSEALQKKLLDKEYAKTILKHTIKILNKRRQNEENFNSIFMTASKLIEDIGLKTKIPRITGKQTNRANLNTNDPLTYYRVNVYLPLLDSIFLDLQFRFPDETLNSFELNVAILRNLLNKTKTKLTASITNILSFMKGLPNINTVDENVQLMKVSSEFEFWELKWKDAIKKQQDLPECALKAYKQCDCNVFPLIKCNLQLLCTLPVSVASGERSFSVLKRLKTWLRSNIGQERLNGLAMMHIHRDCIINIEEIIDSFASLKTRKLNFIL
ncbi:uncharacterized protein LOC124811211 [Hydra vulgaris]|uniref:uncharacterized protein LOC124811211 n=1 Tax=Hydra vulgaris TaxID=6087 RepID=UPI0032EA19AB